MRSANSVRGEVTLDLEGVDYVLRPTYSALIEVEEQTGRGVIELARQANRGELTTRDTAIVATAFIRAGGRARDDKSAANVNPRRVGELLLERPDGLVGAMGTLAAVLTAAATGGYTASGEAKPAAMATETGQQNAAG